MSQQRPLNDEPAFTEQPRQSLPGTQSAKLYHLMNGFQPHTLHCKTPLCTKEILLFTPKEVKDIYLIQNEIVSARHNEGRRSNVSTFLRL